MPPLITWTLKPLKLLSSEWPKPLCSQRKVVDSTPTRHDTMLENTDAWRTSLSGFIASCNQYWEQATVISTPFDKPDVHLNASGLILAIRFRSYRVGTRAEQ